ncbi:MAG: hypothetical protein ACYTAN_03915 [Planctomycetota bacterium]
MFDSEPFGQRAVRLGLATSEQVRHALQTQVVLSQKSGLLGEILVEMGWLDPQDYMSLVQELIEKCGKEVENHEEVQDAFVQEALARGYISGDRLKEAQKIQEGFNRKNRLIGQIMVEMGFISPEECEQIIKTYPER